MHLSPPSANGIKTTTQFSFKNNKESANHTYPTGHPS
jgi:hypothetical protein